MALDSYMKNFHRFALFCTVCFVTSCSTSQNISNNAPTNETGAIYGTGPGYRIPAPQTYPVDLKGVTGAKITDENYSSRGNKDYKVLGQNYMVWRNLDSYYEEGTSSWYGPGFHGKKTSNGEPYNMEWYTAAHKNLPLPSFLKVTNLSNNKSVIVRVNDRGPFHGNRILDLSKGAARAIGVIGPGTAKVRVELIKMASNKKQTSIAVMNGFKPYIQVFVTEDKDKAINIKNQVFSNTSKQAFLEPQNGVYRIKIGPLTPKEANSVLKNVQNIGYTNAFFTAD
jgi:rare lipoprotein A